MGSTTLRTALLAAIVLAGAGPVSEAGAQVLRLRQQHTHSTNVSVAVGDVVTVEVWADLQSVRAAGISFFMTIPEDAFQVIDQAPQAPGVQPYQAGSLFAGAGEWSNLILPPTDPVSRTLPGQQLEYSAVVGGGANRERTGTGVVATVQLVCVAPIENGRLSIDDSPIRQTRLVLSDGITERRFNTVHGMWINVSGVTLREMPDVILRPGQADSVTIGRLDTYVIHTSAPMDSLRWSYAPDNLDHLGIEIDPVTRRVTITPEPGWIGSEQVVFTATEPEARVPGFPPLSASQIIRVIVNNPPRFTLEADAYGVKRDSVRFPENQHPFIGDDGALNRDLAYRWIALHTIAEDEDVEDPRTELTYAALSYGAFTDRNDLRARVDPDTRELLIWSRQNYSGRDSLKVVVRDRYGAEDSLRLMVTVDMVKEPPRFVIADRNPKVSIGGSRVYRLDEIVAVRNVHLNSLEFSWVDDPNGHFTVSTEPVDTTQAITVHGAEGYAGTGRVSFTITDPEDPTYLTDTVVLFFTASKALPPVVYPRELKIDLEPGGPAHTTTLDDYVDDPDDPDEDLVWLHPPPTHRSELRIDAQRVLRVAAPPDFVGYEAVLLTVTDPSNQSDVLKLRIYSSDGRPVVGGLPNLILDRGEVHDDIVLDDYYYDADHDDDQMFWEALPTYDTSNLQIAIDPQTRVITFSVPLDAEFTTETVVLRVTDPVGAADQDTMLVTIRSGGDPGGGEFAIRPLPLDMVVPVGQFIDLIDLDDFVIPPDPSISWDVSRVGGNHSLPQLGADNVLSAFGLQAGMDTIRVSAQDTLGRVKSAMGMIRVVDDRGMLRLLPVPDMHFVAGGSHTSDPLDVYIEDRETHPDSVVTWSLQVLSDTGSLFAAITPERQLFATARDTGTAQVMLLARNTREQVTGRDTLRIVALSPDMAELQLKPLPAMVIGSGQVDTTVVLDSFVPDELLEDGVVPASLRWSVSGQRFTQPEIDAQPPHRLRIKGLEASAGIDTLRFTAEAGAGFRATGTMVVTVLESTDASTLVLEVVPNPLNPRYMNVFVLARRPLVNTPNVLQTFDTSDSVLVMRQIETDLETQGVLIWSGSTALNPGASGTVHFQAQARTVMGSDIADTVSVAIGTMEVGKPMVVAHGGTVLEVPAGSLPGGATVVLMDQDYPGDDTGSAAARSVLARDAAACVAARDELQLHRIIRIMPADLRLAYSGTLRVAGDHAARGQAVYRQTDTGWVFAGGMDEPLTWDRAGTYGVLIDLHAPRIRLSEPDASTGRVQVEVTDQGSGLDPQAVEARWNGAPLAGQFSSDNSRWTLQLTLEPGTNRLSMQAQDRAGNRARLDWEATGWPRPEHTRLKQNYPNPFNMATTIPFTLAPAPGESPDAVQVHLRIYNLGGQRMRRLVSGGMHAGHHQVVWDGCDDAGRPVGSGVYVYLLETADNRFVRRLTLVK